MPPQQSQETSADKDTSVPTATIDKTGVSRNFGHYVAVFLWIGWMNFYFTFTLALPLLYMYNKTLLAILLGPILLSAFTSADRKTQPKICFKLGEVIMKKCAEYFHLRMVVEDKKALDAHSQVIFAMEPHHVLPLSIFGFNDCLKGFDSQKCVGCLTGAAFKIPLIKHMYTWVNSVSVEKRDMMKYLSEGYSPVLCPGGVQEVTLMEKETECVMYLKSRLGFIKLAVTHGIPLVPVFAFGLHNSYNYIVPKSKFMSNLARKIGFLPMAFFGVFGTPLGPAKPCDYTNFIGKPIEIKKNENPSEEELRAVQAQYIDAMKKIFEEHKDEYGMGEFTLRIV
mmetsp:Transcript_18824/g.31522  ORF Transcript_18824/g.31522 Transcript_18824/m.31522 type:complete len:338 (+) Transcript_18824:61-1074(+)